MMSHEEACTYKNHLLLFPPICHCLCMSVQLSEKIAPYYHAEPKLSSATCHMGGRAAEGNERGAYH